MKCHSIDRGTSRRYRVVCKCKYFALNSGTKTRILTPMRYDEHPRPFYMGVPPPGSDTSRTQFDLIFVNNEHRIVKSGVVPVTLSDHYLVFCILKAGVSNKAKPRIIEYRSYKNFDVNKFNNDHRNVP